MYPESVVINVTDTRLEGGILNEVVAEEPPVAGPQMLDRVDVTLMVMVA